ncbi:MAG: patatin-like phospholipase family protein [Rhodobacter sp.]|nr:patatin-like phospholipase family protein [Rhodobacter sp.]MCA3511910.1 patatin-like phospholipase family protein [Rhodobacter sp.]MCA3519082.1 patatin-like phospholipase family protein [Rhodobacter sp.]MCA3522347.1 patatin-like phospholipase family protein [Rhodobacter sp.]MCA3527229.1 patatin-like phospholipase family protein [Rhodobacter sp.]
MVLKINMALQGGGAHGAFTWGVLDRLLEEDGIEIAAISGTSAGALNGAAFKSGWLTGGRRGAKENLDWLWAQVGAVGDMRLAAWMMPFQPWLRQVADAVDAAMPVSPQGLLAQVVSPYGFGPFWRNPLERVVRRFHFDKVCADRGPRLFVGATNVRTGRIRVFSGAEITTEVILASACLPTVFQAVDVPDPVTGKVETYWDGGYTGNPALFPLYDPLLPDDIVIVNINPLRREEVPDTAVEIQNRINEISFNASLLSDLRAINFVKELIADGKIARGAMKDVLVHMIADDPLMNGLSAGSKQLASPYLLFRLKDAGRTAAAAFLKAHRKDIGKRASVDLQALFG